MQTNLREYTVDEAYNLAVKTMELKKQVILQGSLLREIRNSRY